jgi:BolA protein
MKKKLTDLLIAAFSPIHLSVIDDSARHKGHRGISMPHESHFRIEIVSSCFKNRTRLIRHRLVYQALESVFVHSIHALAISAHTPEEYSLMGQNRKDIPKSTES